MQLGAILGGDPQRFKPGMRLAIQTAGTREAELWLFTVVGQEVLALLGGNVTAPKLSRNPEREFEPG